MVAVGQEEKCGFEVYFEGIADSIYCTLALGL